MSHPSQQSDRDPGHLSSEPEPGPVGQLLRLFLTQLLAVVVIAAVITAVVSWTGAGLHDKVTAGPGPSREKTAGSPTPGDSTPSGTTEAPSPDATTSSAPASTAAPSPTQQLPRVDVLNQSAPGGSAAQTADRLQERGWRIGRVDDFRGNVSETTVYYQPGLRQEARQLRRDLPGSPRLQPAFSTLKDNRLSVILVG